jgi:hypothetical protein
MTSLITHTCPAIAALCPFCWPGRDLEGSKLTRSQALWAEEHDWCISTKGNTSGAWTVSVSDPELPQGSRIFTDFQDLKAWAGY